jgi:hypothetical protein
MFIVLEIKKFIYQCCVFLRRGQNIKWHIVKSPIAMSKVKKDLCLFPHNQ